MYLGAIFAAFLALVFSNKLNNNNDSITWRILLIFGSVLTIPIFYMRKNIPESPRWLLYKGKPSEADLVVDHISYCC
jgi:hypothetical protein